MPPTVPRDEDIDIYGPERGLRVLVALPFRERERGRSAEREAAASKPPPIPL